jgi:hypothetical protein
MPVPGCRGRAAARRRGCALRPDLAEETLNIGEDPLLGEAVTGHPVEDHAGLGDIPSGGRVAECLARVPAPHGPAGSYPVALADDVLDVEMQAAERGAERLDALPYRGRPGRGRLPRAAVEDEVAGEDLIEHLDVPLIGHLVVEAQHQVGVPHCLSRTV